MTDNEIIKALKCCHQVNGCERCPLRNDTDECEILNTYALDLLLRQKAEIEGCSKKYELSEAEREANVKGFTESIAIVKSEAIKEFAERLKEKSEHFWNEKENFVSEADIDNLVKEMTEENEGK